VGKLKQSVAARSVLVSVVAALAAVGVAACGSSDSSDTSSSGGATTAATSGGGADQAAATAAIKPYVGKPTPFPVDRPLKEKPAADITMSQLQFGTPTGALVAQLIDGAAKLGGFKMNTVKAGATASETQAAATTMISQNPDAILLPASEPSLFSEQLKEMETKGIPVASAGIMYPQKYGIDAAMFDENTAALAGKIMADWVVARQGDSANVVWIETPELSFNGVETDAFVKEMQAMCSACAVRRLPISAAEHGSEAPSKIVSDLQSHPDTNVAAFSSVEATAGLPAALSTAGLKVKIIGWGTDPGSLTYLQNGQIDAVLAFDAAVMEWTVVDEALRLIQGTPLTAGEKKALPPIQLIEQKDVQGADVSKGFSAYPDFVQRFTKLWKVGP
jgi:ribose transport system substrate-binding protein